MTLRLEKVANLDWLRGHPPEPFFRALERMGFYVEHRELEKFREHIKETEWFAVDTERGILAEAETMDSKLNYVRMTLIHPKRQTLRRIAFQSLKDNSVYSSRKEKFPSYWNVSASFYSMRCCLWNWLPHILSVSTCPS
ncbi:MAG: hypothetical protein IJ849_04645 [Selenomonadaceae bacterium]|nr:hypothetical protein [Selenomonadaceae bacterium]